jgi:hypothetical protein
LILALDSLCQQPFENLRAVDLPNDDVIIGEIIQSGKLTCFDKRLHLVPRLTLLKDLVKANASQGQEAPRFQRWVKDEMGHHFVLVLANYQVTEVKNG